ncbi:hypothetical protein OLT26_09135, partial [Campylobacter jejuni]|nr:hypothetical protein [Campylobacter jejuni]
HSKNFPMNSLFKKLDFNFCGNFDIPNYQDPFLAYEKILNQKAFEFFSLGFDLCFMF